MSGESRIPQNRKFKKDRKGNKGRIIGNATRGFKLTHGDYGLQALDKYKLTPQQIESMRVAIIRSTKAGGVKDNKPLIIKVFPQKPVTSKPTGIRMGGGKSSVDHWVCIVKPGKVLFELTNVPEAVAKRALEIASYKIPIKTQFITRKESI